MKKAGIIGLLTTIMILATASTAVACEIDIKPWSNPNAININSNGVVPVAILTESGFDARWVDQSTIKFAGANPVRCAFEDVDYDGDLDLICHFNKQDLDLSSSSTSALLECYMLPGTPAPYDNNFHFMAWDSVKIVGDK